MSFFMGRPATFLLTVPRYHPNCPVGPLDRPVTGAKRGRLLCISPALLGGDNRQDAFAGVPRSPAFYQRHCPTRNSPASHLNSVNVALFEGNVKGHGRKSRSRNKKPPPRQKGGGRNIGVRVPLGQWTSGRFSELPVPEPAHQWRQPCPQPTGWPFWGTWLHRCHSRCTWCSQ